jgi:hypothetical protein
VGPAPAWFTQLVVGIFSLVGVALLPKAFGLL